MTLFQWVFAPILLVSSLVTLVLTLRGRVRRRVGLLWSFIWCLSAVVVLVPSLTARAAAVFGIGRGVDLIIYLNLIAGLYVTVAQYTRSRRLETTITELVRQRALSEAAQGKPGPAPTPPPPSEGPPAAAKS